MGELVDRLDRMRVRASTNNGAVTAELHGTDRVRLEFATGYYRRLDHGQLESALASLGRALWAARLRGYQTVVEDSGGQVLGRQQLTGSRDREFIQQIDALVALGRSPDGR